MKRVLLLATTTGYQTRMFAEAATNTGVELIYATDRCDQLEDPWSDGAIAVRYHEEWKSVDAVLKAVDERSVNAVVAVERSTRAQHRSERKRCGDEARGPGSRGVMVTSGENAYSTDLNLLT